ncbi:MAG: peptide synthetase, partial [Microbacterium chocolatum]|nr:peptide synthetase [Microbacterium chocolatum]
GFSLADATMSDGRGLGGGVHDGRRVLTFSVDLAPGESATATVRADTAEPSASVLEVVQTPGVTASAVPAAACGSAAP